jgi:hypothetical protein
MFSIFYGVVWCGVDNIHIYRTTQLMLQNHIRYAILRYAKPFNAYGRGRGVSVIAERYFFMCFGFGRAIYNFARVVAVFQLRIWFWFGTLIWFRP